MSLESDVGNLVTQATSLIDYFKTRKAGIDASVAAAIAAVPAMNRTWYVDQVSGLDTNDGSAAAPFKTVGKAMASTPANGICFVNLLSDYNFNDTTALTVGYLVLNGNGATRKLYPKYYQTVDGQGVTATVLGGFSASSVGYTVEIRGSEIVLPSPAGQVPAPNVTRSNSFVRTNSGSNLPPYVSLVLQAPVITMASDFYGALIGLSASSAILSVSGGTIPTAMLGHYLSNVGTPAGTDPKTLNYVLTNLSAI
ncbi:hypothetical protein N5D52_20730 [Pseudomonas sp. GD03860]|uniref:hypothetical protein n=1 Tax=Pseudomonas TaxID=286 RepID=UPI002363CE62|nr:MULTISPECIES: hypothetical protein [Pseudomonas]MDD2059063.1 hypothetical protein [Pseudomonas putida]MDH0639360.1 hypothetical protein [Pseudomonas sp. GD03860]